MALDPPKVNIITTGRNTFRFNPNLYKNGKLQEENESNQKEAMDEDAVEQLRPSLEWSSELEYENYIKNWQTIGTSVNSGKYQNHEITAVTY